MQRTLQIKRQNMKKQYDPVWKRWKTVPSAVEDCADVTSGMKKS